MKSILLFMVTMSVFSTVSVAHSSPSIEAKEDYRTRAEGSLTRAIAKLKMARLRLEEKTGVDDPASFIEFLGEESDPTHRALARQYFREIFGTFGGLLSYIHHTELMPDNSFYSELMEAFGGGSGKTSPEALNNNVDYVEIIKTMDEFDKVIKKIPSLQFLKGQVRGLSRYAHRKFTNKADIQTSGSFSESLKEKKLQKLVPKDLPELECKKFPGYNGYKRCVFPNGNSVTYRQYGSTLVIGHIVEVVDSKDQKIPVALLGEPKKILKMNLHPAVEFPVDSGISFQLVRLSNSQPSESGKEKISRTEQKTLKEFLRSLPENSLGRYKVRGKTLSEVPLALTEFYADGKNTIQNTFLMSWKKNCSIGSENPTWIPASP